ncbi:MAG: hypothetical protein ABI398_13255 [Devosia sp.]
MRGLGLILLTALVSFGGVYGVLRTGVGTAVFASPSCSIKGNISINSGERIYHVPGQAYYDATIITPTKGERWFCTEAEARAAGWRRAGY